MEFVRTSCDSGRAQRGDGSRTQQLSTTWRQGACILCVHVCTRVRVCAYERVCEGSVTAWQGEAVRAIGPPAENA